MKTEIERAAAIEALLDATPSLRDFLTDLAGVCAEKAAHVAENWQDTALAGCWDQAADMIAALAGKVEV